MTQPLDRTGLGSPKPIVLALRLAGAGVVAYLVAKAVFPAGRPILAPLTALLVVQVTLSNTVKAGFRRMAGVVAGVMTAVLFSALVGFSWWSLGVVIGVSLIVGQLLRLREQLLEAPISAMLVLAVGGAEAPATDRITETLVGAVVGILYNVVLPGSATARPAGEAVQQFAADVAALLDSMGSELAGGVSVDDATRWLEAARRLDNGVASVDRAIVYAEESRRLNVRALGTKDTVPSLRSGLDALEHCTVAIRGLCRAIVDQLHARPEPDEAYSDEVRQVLAGLLHELAAAVSAFGRVVGEEATAAGEPRDQELSKALKAVRATRTRLSELLLEEARNDLALWELHGTLLVSLERIIQEIDADKRARQRERRRRQWAARPPAVQAVDRIRRTSRQVARRPMQRRGRRVAGPRRRSS